MRGFELYSFILCLIVFLLLTGGFAILIGYIVKMSIKLIKHGVEDERILKEYNYKISKTKSSKIADLLSSAFSAVVSVFFISVFAFSFYLNYCEKIPVDDVPVLKVVQSDSMATKNEENDYLFYHKLNNQFDIYDIVLVYSLPNEEDLKLYDIVVYEKNDDLIIHRIVGIEEPNDKHPNERYFLLQGDAIKYPDAFPVKYEQMQGIYRGEKIKFIGSFIVFLQSPIGWLCLVLIFANLFVTPIITKKLSILEEERLSILFKNDNESTDDENNEPQLVGNIEKEEQEEQFSFSFNTKSFEEKLICSSQILKERYLLIKQYLLRIEKCKVRRSKKYESYRKGRLIIAKLMIKGKTLNVYLNLNPNDFKNSKYIYQDASEYKSLSSTPMRIKITSDRMLKYSNELIMHFANVNGLVYNSNLVIKRQSHDNVLDEELVVDKFGFDFTFKTFEEKLLSASEVLKQRYASIKESLLKINKVKVRRSKRYETFKVGKIIVAKFIIRGKTLNAYLNLNPKNYENTKYVYRDVSTIKSYESTPLRIRLTSERSVRYTNELILEIVKNYNFKLNDKIINVSNKKIVKNLCIALLFASLSPISKVNASWSYAEGNAGDIVSPNRILFNMESSYISNSETILVNNILNDAANGLNNPNSYLNRQITARQNPGFGKVKRDTLGSMGVDQSSQLAEDFGLDGTGLSFIVQFVDSNSDGTVDYYYLYTTSVYLGERGTAGIFSNRTPGNPSTPLESYIYPISRVMLTKDSNGDWVSGNIEVGSAISAWYEESNGAGNITQIPAWDVDTWTPGERTN